MGFTSFLCRTVMGCGIRGSQRVAGRLGGPEAGGLDDQQQDRDGDDQHLGGEAAKL
jgi:hypothetical protein